MSLLLGCHVRNWSFNHKVETPIKISHWAKPTHSSPKSVVEILVLPNTSFSLLLTSGCLCLQSSFCIVYSLFCFCVLPWLPRIRSSAEKACWLDGLSSPFYTVRLKPSSSAQYPWHWLGTLAGSFLFHHPTKPCHWGWHAFTACCGVHYGHVLAMKWKSWSREGCDRSIWGCYLGSRVSSYSFKPIMFYYGRCEAGEKTPCIFTVKSWGLEFGDPVFTQKPSVVVHF